MANLFDESDQSIEEAMGMSLEQARDICALNYVNVVFRIVGRELGVEMPTGQAVVEGLSDLTVALNCGANIAFCLYVEDHNMAQRMIDKLQTLVDEIPRSGK